MQHMQHKAVEELFSSQKDQPGTYLSQRKIANAIDMLLQDCKCYCKIRSRILRNVICLDACQKKIMQNLNYKQKHVESCTMLKKIDRLLVAEFSFP